MDDLSEKLAGILNDPDSMEKVRKMAQSILGEGEKNEPPPQSSNVLSALSDGMPDAETLGRIMQIMNRFRSDNRDERSTLLLALRPHLSEPRQEKLDTAIKFLKMIDLLPLLKESGLFKL